MYLPEQALFSNLSDLIDDVEGLIIGLKDDPNLKYAISEVPKVKFMRYKIDFQLIDKTQEII